MEIIIIILLGVCLVWLLLNRWKRVAASNEVNLQNAWRVVLNDPNYKERRILEERKHSVEKETRKLGS